MSFKAKPFLAKLNAIAKACATNKETKPMKENPVFVAMNHIKLERNGEGLQGVGFNRIQCHSIENVVDSTEWKITWPVYVSLDELKAINKAMKGVEWLEAFDNYDGSMTLRGLKFGTVKPFCYAGDVVDENGFQIDVRIEHKELTFPLWHMSFRRPSELETFSVKRKELIEGLKAVKAMGKTVAKLEMIPLSWQPHVPAAVSLRPELRLQSIRLEGFAQKWTAVFVDVERLSMILDCCNDETVQVYAADTYPIEVRSNCGSRCIVTAAHVREGAEY